MTAIHRRTRTEPARKRVLLALGAAETKLKKALAHLKGLVAAYDDDPGRRLSEDLLVKRARLTFSAAQAADMYERVRNSVRGERARHPEYFEGERSLMPWERSAVDLLKGISELRDSVSAETEKFPRGRPKELGEVELFLRRQGHSDSEIAELLKEHDLEGAGDARERVRSRRRRREARRRGT